MSGNGEKGAALSIDQPWKTPRRRQLFTFWTTLGLAAVMFSLYALWSPEESTMGLIGLGLTKVHSSASASDSTSSLNAALENALSESIPLTSSQVSDHASPTTSWRSIPTLPESIGYYPPLLPNVLDSDAVDAQTVCPGYVATNVETTAHGFVANLNLAGDPCHVYGTDIDSLSLTVEFQSDNRVYIKISPSNLDISNITQYEIPSYYVAQPGVDDDAGVGNSDLQVTWSNSPSFSFKVLRKSTSDILFDTTGNVLVFENQFVEFRSAMPENYNLFGLGERTHGIRLGNNLTATIYAADRGIPIDYNLYGAHPFYLDTRYYEVDEVTGKFSHLTTEDVSDTATYTSISHGVYYRNAHAHEVILKPTSLTWRTIGGNIELYFFSGPTQPEVTSQYTSVIGLPALHQYWALGYHQARWGYANWSELQDVVDSFEYFQVPVECLWVDLDYMNQYRDFENDQHSYPYPEGKAFLDGLHSRGQHWVPIVDSAIYAPNPLNESDTYETYNRGNASGAFITLNKDSGAEQYYGAVWPGFTVYPDWHAQGTQGWWTSELVMWHDKVAFDGIWIDMSEVSSFCAGSCGTGRITENPVHPPFNLPGEFNAETFEYSESFRYTNQTEYEIAVQASSAQASRIAAAATPAAVVPYLRTTPIPGVRNVTFPPYVINNLVGALGGHAISPDSYHADGTEEYDIHNLWGAGIINATYNGLLSVFPGKRPFIIARSHFAGSGMFAGHWGGDNSAVWQDMYFSIPQAIAHSLYGQPMFGTDACGFAGNSDHELCSRWMELAAFFTFYRNHNIIKALPQEPYRWSSVLDAYRKASAIRYSLLPYMYTLMYQAHAYGSTVVRALSWEFPNDPTLVDADRQFMLGPSIMIVPVLEPLARQVKGVFPGVRDGTKWYDWYTHEAVKATPGENKTIDAPLSHIPVFIRGGSVLALQAPGLTTAASRENEWTVLVALSKKGTATGGIYLDDGESLVPEETRDVALTAQGGNLYVSVTGTYGQSQPLANVTLLGLSHEPKDVSWNGKSLSSWTYDKEKSALYITDLARSTSKGAWMADWTLSWS